MKRESAAMDEETQREEKGLRRKSSRTKVLNRFYDDNNNHSCASCVAMNSGNSDKKYNDNLWKFNLKDETFKKTRWGKITWGTWSFVNISIWVSQFFVQIQIPWVRITNALRIEIYYILEPKRIQMKKTKVKSYLKACYLPVKNVSVNNVYRV